jgi:RNA polymerase sigma-70 factor (ECF subfamily)
VQDATVTTVSRADTVRATYEEVHLPLWRALVAWGGSTHVADDAVAEAFAQLLRRGDAVDDARAWVWRSAFRIAAGELQRGRREAHDTPALTMATEDPEAESLLIVIAALGDLTDQQRAGVVLCDLLGFRAQEAAELLHTTATTIRMQRMRARRHLRRALEDHDD